MSYPQQWPPQPQQYPQQWPSPYPPPSPAPRKTNVALVVVLAVAATVVLVPAALVGFFLIRDIARDGHGRVEQATSVSNFDVVCDHGSIGNAATYAKPYKVVAFAPDEEPNPMNELSGTHWSEVTLDPRSDYRVSPEDFRSVNVVACLTRKPGIEAKSRTCNLATDSGERVAVDFYSTQYEMELREARTGRSIERLGTVDGPVTDCPFMVWVNKREPKVYAGPDSKAVDAKLAEFAHR